MNNRINLLLDSIWYCNQAGHIKKFGQTKSLNNNYFTNCCQISIFHKALVCFNEVILATKLAAHNKHKRGKEIPRTLTCFVQTTGKDVLLKFLQLSSHIASVFSTFTSSASDEHE